MGQIVLKEWCVDLWGTKVCFGPVPWYEPDASGPGVGYVKQDINEMISEAISNTIIGISNGLDYVQSALADAREKLIDGLTAAVRDPKHGGVALLGIFLTTMVLSIGWEALQTIAQVKAITVIIKGIGDTLSSIGRFLKLDLILTLIRLGGLFNDEWHKALANIYVSLGKISQELETDFSFINVFAEVDRSILFTAYSLTDNPWLQAQAGYAEGLTNWLGGLTDKLGHYSAHPESVFIDLQKAIVDKATDDAAEKSSRVLSAVDKASYWIENSGNAVLDEVDYINELLLTLPSDLSEAILAHMQPYIDKLNYFVDNTWTPFFEQYHEAQSIIGDYFEAHNIRLRDLERNINDPFDLIDNLLLLTGGKSREAADKLWYSLTGGKLKEVSTAAAAIDASVVSAATVAVSPIPDATPAIGAPAVAPVTRAVPPTVPLPDATWNMGDGAGPLFPPGQMPSDGTAWYFGE